MELNSVVLGARLWIWLFFLFNNLIVVVALLIWNKERIRKKYYDIFKYERVVKVVIHYKTGYYREFFRLIPDHDFFTIGNKVYKYEDKDVLKVNDFFTRRQDRKPNQFIEVDGVKYDFVERIGIKLKGRNYPEIHYFYNVPYPVSFVFDTKKIPKLEFSATSLKDFKENDLFTKLLTMKDTMNMMMILIIIVGINMIISLFLLAKEMGWIK